MLYNFKNIKIIKLSHLNLSHGYWIYFKQLGYFYGILHRLLLKIIIIHNT